MFQVGLGKSAYKQIDKSELFSNFVRQKGKLPVNQIDILSCPTPLTYEKGAREQLPERNQRARVVQLLRLPLPLPPHVHPHRYLDMIFHGFDISADGSVEAKVSDWIPSYINTFFNVRISFQISLNLQYDFSRSLSMCLLVLPT